MNSFNCNNKIYKCITIKGGITVAVVNVLNIVGDSTISWDDAIQKAVQEASKTIKNISGIEVKNQTANVKDGKIVEFKANIEVAYRVDNNNF